MSIFDNKRLTNKTIELDIERMRRGWYSDKYFENIGRMLTRSSRVATNVYETLMAARGKPALFLPAHSDLHEVQAADGYAYNIAIQRFDMDFSQQIGSFVSTDAQGDWWGGAGGRTDAHAAIASFLGDTAEAMMQFSRILLAHILRIALVDFNNQ
ncbi:MAG TPA: hypothetical protein VFZ43_10310 [Anaerolineales bacterium]